MSGFAERVVALAADQLPEPERSRRSEEWSADLEGAKAQGLSRIGVALGALTFALKAPVANRVAADWWARWALALAAIGPVAMVYFQGADVAGSRTLLKTTIAISTFAVIGLVALVALRSRGTPWRAASAAMMLCVVALLWLVGNPARPLDLRVLLLWALVTAAFLTLGLRMHATKAGSLAHRNAVFAFAALPAMNFVVHQLPWSLMSWAAQWGPLIGVGVALVVALIVISRRPREQCARSTSLERIATTTLAAMAALVTGASVAAAITAATANYSGPFMKQEAANAPDLLMASVGTGIAAFCALAAYIVLVRIARGRGATTAVAALGFGLAAGLARVLAGAIWVTPWAEQIGSLIDDVLGLAGWVFVAVTVVLLVAPLNAARTQHIRA